MYTILSYDSSVSTFETIITMHAVTRLPFRLTPLEVSREERDGFILFVASKGGA